MVNVVGVESSVRVIHIATHDGPFSRKAQSWCRPLSSDVITITSTQACRKLPLKQHIYETFVPVN